MRTTRISSSNSNQRVGDMKKSCFSLPLVLAALVFSSIVGSTAYLIMQSYMPQNPNTTASSKTSERKLYLVIKKPNEESDVLELPMDSHLGEEIEMVERAMRATAKKPTKPPTAIPGAD